MARIRTIKPDFWESTKIGRLSMQARLLFICMWNYCDDGGNYPAFIPAMRRNCFGFDDVTIADVQGWMDELIGRKLVALYEADGEEFWHVVGFKEHQRIEKPVYKYPPFTDSTTHPKPVDDSSTTIPRPVDDQSTTHPKPVGDSSTTGKEGKGKESKGKEIGVGTNEVVVPQTAQPCENFKTLPGDIARVFRENGFQCQVGDPRIREMGRQGLDLMSLDAACKEARSSKPGENLPFTFAVRILERWAKEADGMKVNGARKPGKPKSTQEQLAEWHALKEAQLNTIDVEVKELQ